MFIELVIGGNTFKHNWNGFCLREKYINMHILYEHRYFSISIMISFVADAYDSRTLPMICVVFL